MKRCDDGHYFDSARHTACPFCGPDISEMGETYAQVPPRPGDSGVEFEPSSSELVLPTPPPISQNPPDVPSASHGETVAYWGQREFDPIVGWLVCIEGANKGTDYRIRRGNNTIGRDPSMNIVLDDPSISRHRQAVLAFDKRTNAFMIKEGEARGLVYRNGNPISGSEPLLSWDKLEFGDSESKYLFVPLVGEHFQWQVDEA